MSELQFNGLTEKEARAFKPLLTKFMKSYAAKESGVTDEEWLNGRFREEFPGKSDEEIRQMSHETVVSIAEYDSNLSDLNKACASGKNSEKWFSDKVKSDTVGVSAQKYGDYLQDVNTNISSGNDLMTRVILTKDLDISQARNLDGFIAEQHHVNSFNNQAALEKSGGYRAEVPPLKPGQTFGKNSFDVVIKDVNSGKIVHQYQAKYGKDADATITLIKKGDYSNQRLLVPPDQVEAVQREFPGKTVVASIGGTDIVKTKSVPLTKEQAKQFQIEAQEYGKMPQEGWNASTIKALSLDLGGNAARAGMQSAAITTGFALVQKVFSGEGIEADEVVETALKSGADAGVKCAVTGAVITASEKGILSVIPKGTAPGIIANVVCVAIENAKIMGKIAKGELTVTEGLDHMKRTTVTMTAGLVGAAKGATIGASALSWIPVAGPVVGGFVGGMVGYMAGSKAGEVICDTAKKVAAVAKETVKSAWEKAKETVGGVFSGVKKLASSWW